MAGRGDGGLPGLAYAVLPYGCLFHGGRRNLAGIFNGNGASCGGVCWRKHGVCGAANAMARLTGYKQLSQARHKQLINIRGIQALQ